MLDEFLNSLIKTNRSHLFYVDWEKARSYQDRYKDELALLQVMTGNNQPKNELTRLIKAYPKINTLIPLLVACRLKPKGSEHVAELVVLDEDKITTLGYKFADSNLSDPDIQATVAFAEKTGLLKELIEVHNHADFYFGIEVGLDTNARKNRSGDAMELLVEDFVKEITGRHGGQYLQQKNFAYAAKEFEVNLPQHQANKKGDFMVLINSKPFNIEVNYFDGSGSKQEIMNSYIPRADDIKKSGWGFVLVTDGAGWLSNKAQLEEGFSRIKTICNIKMCHDGVLEKYLTT